MIREAIAAIAAGATLEECEAAAVMDEIMTAAATQALRPPCVIPDSGSKRPP